MITITGTIEDVEGVVQHVAITFTAASTPLVDEAGLITANSNAVVWSDTATGAFSVGLRPGDYTVTFTVDGRQTRFTISVSEEDDGLTLPISEVITTPLTWTALAPNTVWNGERAGHITFLPIDDPGAPTGSIVDYTGGTVTSELYRYRVSYETSLGETAMGAALDVDESIAADHAIRISTVVSPPNASAKRIWRNAAAASPDTMYLLAELSPGVEYYDDYESHAVFAARKGSEYDAPTLNTTAGKIFGDRTTEILNCSKEGFRSRVPATFDSTVTFSGGTLRIRDQDSNWWDITVTVEGGIPDFTFMPV